MQNNIYTVTVKKGNEVDHKDIHARNESDAKRDAINYFYFDGWHAVSAKLKVTN